MALVDLEGQFLKVNETLCELLGYSENELLKFDFQKVTHPEDLNTDLDYLAQVYKGEINSYEIEKRYFKKDRKEVWVRLRVSTVRDENEQPKVYISKIEDITLLKEREQQLNYLIDADSDGFWDWHLHRDAL